MRVALDWRVMAFCKHCQGNSLERWVDGRVGDIVLRDVQKQFEFDFKMQEIGINSIDPLVWSTGGN